MKPGYFWAIAVVGDRIAETIGRDPDCDESDLLLPVTQEAALALLGGAVLDMRPTKSGFTLTIRRAAPFASSCRA